MNVSPASSSTAVQAHAVSEAERALVLATIQADGRVLKRYNNDNNDNTSSSTPSWPCDDPECVLIAIRQCGGLALTWASPTLRANPAFVQRALALDAYYVYRACACQDDLATIRTAVKHNGRVLALVPWRIRNTQRDVVDTAVTQHGLALRHATEQWQDDERIVLAAVQNNGYALAFASPRLRGYKTIIRTAVQHAGQALEYARYNPDNMTTNEWFEICYLAVQRDGYALCWIGGGGGEQEHDEWQDNRTLVEMAVRQNASALWLAPPRFKADKTIVMQALRQGHFPLKHVDASLYDDPDVVAAYIRGTPYLARWTHEVSSNNSGILDQIQDIVQALKQQEKWHGKVIVRTSLCHDEDRVEKDTTAALVHFAQYTWKRAGYERVWLLQQALPEQCCRHVQIDVLSWAAVPHECFVQARALVRLAPILGALQARKVDWRNISFEGILRQP